MRAKRPPHTSPRRFKGGKGSRPPPARARAKRPPHTPSRRFKCGKGSRPPPAKARAKRLPQEQHSRIKGSHPAPHATSGIYTEATDRAEPATTPKARIQTEGKTAEATDQMDTRHPTRPPRHTHRGHRAEAAQSHDTASRFYPKTEKIYNTGADDYGQDRNGKQRPQCEETIRLG